MNFGSGQANPSQFSQQQEQVQEESSQSSSSNSNSESEQKSQDSQSQSDKSKKNKKQKKKKNNKQAQQQQAENQKPVQQTDQQEKLEKFEILEQEDKNQTTNKQGNTSKITPGYKKFVIDETTADYDYIKGMFTDEEIREAFQTLDQNKDGLITQDDLVFFLEYIDEKATEEEIEEMIKMCDADGNGEVTLEEFYKLASGQSLAPIGQAFPPTQEMVEQRNHLQTLWKGQQETQSPGKSGKKNKLKLQELKLQAPDTINDLKRKRPEQVQTNKSQGQSLKSSMVQKNNFVKSENQSKVMGKSDVLMATSDVQNRNTEEENGEQQQQTETLTKNQLNLPTQVLQKIFLDKKKYLENYCLQYLIDKQKFRKIYEIYMSLPLSDNLADYEQFVNIIESDNNYYHDLFMALTKDSEDGLLNLTNFMIQLISVYSLSPKEKWALIFTTFKSDYLVKENIFQVYQNTKFKIEIPYSKIEQKIQIVRERPNCKNKHSKKEVIDKDMFDDLVNSFPTYFSF